MSSIEGLKILITSQDIKFPKRSIPSKKRTLAGETLDMFPVTLNINGEGKIIIEHDPKVAIFCVTSLLDRDSIINGRRLSGFCEEPIKSYIIGEEGRTHAHRGQHTHMEGISYLLVCEDHSGNAVEKMPRDMFLPINNNNNILSLI